MTEKIQGAEATVEIGQEQVVKKREAKRYRHPELDERLRQERTETEEELMARAKQHGVNVPDILSKDDGRLEMEKIDGKTLKQVLEDEPELLRSLGRNVAHMHSAGVVHGDMTTSNVMVQDGEVFLIDFGLAFLSQRAEDRAVDIHLLRQVLRTSHPDTAEEGWKLFVEGYSKFEDSDEVLSQLEEVEKRGRYK